MLTCLALSFRLNMYTVYHAGTERIKIFSRSLFSKKSTLCRNHSGSRKVLVSGFSSCTPGPELFGTRCQRSQSGAISPRAEWGDDHCYEPTLSGRAHIGVSVEFKRDYIMVCSPMEKNQAVPLASMLAD